MLLKKEEKRYVMIIKDVIAFNVSRAQVVIFSVYAEKLEITAMAALFSCSQKRLTPKDKNWIQILS
jgi:hypothetical protein